MRWIVASSLKARFIVLALAAAMMYFGFSALSKMPVDAFPEFAPPRVEIQTEAPGLSTAETEEILTIPLEEVLAGMPGLDVMRSKTVPALSQIVLIFEPGTDLFQARQLVNERIATVNLPSAIGVPRMLPPLSSTSRAIFIAMSSDEIEMIKMSQVAFWMIRPRLMRIEGVANVAIWGERLHHLQVQVDPERLRAHDVTLDDVMTVTAEALEVGILPYAASSEPGTGGWIESPTQRFAVSNILPISTAAELGQVAVYDKQNTDGSPLILNDLGNVLLAHPPLIGDAVINDGDGLLLIVEKFPWGNTLEVTRDVEATLEELKPGLSGIEIDTTIFRPATFIELSIDNLAKAMLIAAALVVLVLFVFLYEWRVALVSVIAIPLSLMGAMLVLSQLGATINVMILAGLVIAIGAVVDDAIIDVENIVRRLRQHRAEGSGKSTASIVIDASVEVRGAIVFATLIEIVAVAPVFFLEGLSGAFFQPLALAFALAVAASMIVALTVTPALSFILLSNAPLEGRESPVARWLHEGYQKILAPIINKTPAIFATVAVIVALGIVVVPRLGQELLPEFKERDFLMHWVTQPGTSHEEMYRITVEASKELRAVPGVRNFGAHIGRALASDEVVGINFTENWVSIDPEVDYATTVAAIQEVVDGYPGLRRDVQTYLKERVKEVLTGTSEAIVVRIYGPDLDVLRDLAHDIELRLSSVEGLVDLHTELQVDIPQIEVEVNLALADGYGIKPGDVRRAAAAYMSSTEVGDYYAEGKALDVAVWSTPETRNSLTSLTELLLDTNTGQHVPLGDVAEVRVVSTPDHIERENVTRRIDVLANVGGRDLGSAVADVEAELDKVDFPLEYRAELLGEFQERQSAQTSLSIYGVAAGITIFLLLYSSFGSFRLATLSFLTLPAALVGGVLAAYLAGGVISLGSLVGFLTVFGIAARNGIMLINHFQHLENYEGETFGTHLVLRGANERVVPILMTTLSTALALVPLVIAGNIAGHEIEHPMAIVILGGLITSTLLNLFVVPSLYLRYGKSPAEKQQLVHG